MDFEKWILNKNSKRKNTGKTYRERVLSGEQKGFRDKPRSKLKSASKKKRKELSEYKKECNKFLRDNPKCEICGREENLSIHHKMGRGKNLCNPNYFMSACLVGGFLDNKYPDSNHNHTGGCHGWIEANKTLSRELGYILYK